MFQVPDQTAGRRVRLFAAGLAVLSLIALTITAWILSDVRREQEIVERLIGHLPETDLAVAEELSGDLRLQSGLSVLLVINLFGTAIAFALVMQRYANSERSLRDVKVLATDILASMDAGVITTDRHGRVTSINPRGTELIGIDKKSLNRSLRDADPQHRLLAELCDDVLQNHQGIRDRDYTVSHRGHRQTMRTSCTLLRHEGGAEIGTVIQVRDVSERALIEERLRRMERYMGLGTLASGLHHEIKNPLSALLLHIQLLSERMAEKSTDLQVDELLDVIHQEVRRINDVLDGFRNYASVTELGRSEVNPVVLIEKLLRLIKPQAERQQVSLRTDFGDGIQAGLRADSIRLEQVLLNLTLNAMAAMPDGGTLTIGVRRQEDLLRIDVGDTGSGIPADIRSQIFDPYFTTKNEGTGMGLALCDKIVRQHDGVLEFQSDEAGTVFSVYLPIGTTK